MSAPKHITELLNKILSESPDRPLRGAYDCEAEADDKLESIGLDPKTIKQLRWSDEEAVTFAVDAKYHVVMWVANSADQRAFQHADMDDLFTGGLRDAKIDKGVSGMDWNKYKILARWHKDFFNSGERANANMMMGRLWRKNRFVSFWNRKADVMKEWRVIEDFIVNLGIDPRKCIYEFIDKLDVELYGELKDKDSISTKKMSPGELSALHTNTDGGIEKKKALGNIGKYRSAQSQYSRIGDGTLKLGNLLKEDPDKIKTDDGQWEFTDIDAVTFIYRVQDALLFKVRTGQGWDDKSKMFHSDLLGLFSSIGNVFKHDSIDTEEGDNEKIRTVYQFNEYSDIMGLDITWDDRGGLIHVGNNKTIQCFGDTNKTIKFFESLATNDPDEIICSSFRMKYSSIGIMGRYWEDTEVSSFWLNKRDLGRLIAKGSMDAYFEYMGIDTENAKLNTIERNAGIFSVKDALQAATGKATISKKDMTDIMSRKHLGKGNKNIAGDKDETDVAAEKKRREDNYELWQSTPHIRKKDAAYNNLLPALEELNVLHENPDTVMDPNGSGRTLCKWYDGSANAFFAFPNLSAILPTEPHDVLWRGIRQCYREQSLEPLDRNSDYSDMKFSSIPEALEQLKPTSFLGKQISLDLENKLGDIRNSIPNTLVGRIWTNKKVISFWNKRSDVLARWKNIEEMFNSDIGKRNFGKLEDYQIDWIERDHDGRDMTPTSKISSSEKSDDQLGFIKQLIDDPNEVDDETLNKLREKLHLLDPREKKEAMELLGMTTPHKAAVIADKLGMSVAEFNHIMKVNESAIRLKNFVPRK